MSYWNYRVMRIDHLDKREDYGIFEVRYSDDNEVKGWTKEAVQIYTDNLEDIEETLDQLKLALKRPILNYKTGKEVK